MDVLDFFYDGTVCPVECDGRKFFATFSLDVSFFADFCLAATFAGKVRHPERFVVELVIALFMTHEAFILFKDLAVPAVFLDVAFLVRLEATVLFGEDSVVVPFFPHANGVTVLVVMFLERLVAVEMPAFPVAHGVVILVVAYGFLPAAVQPFYKIAGPLAFALAVLVFSVERYVAEHCPALDFPVRHSVLVCNFELLDAVVVPLVALENLAVGVNPHGGFLCAVHVIFDDLFLGALDTARAKAGTSAQKRQKGQKCRKKRTPHVHQSRKKVISSCGRNKK